jgi:hypothetical protein
MRKKDHVLNHGIGMLWILHGVMTDKWSEV